MKTSKQHSEEIFEKIAKREAAKVRVKKRALRVFAFSIMFGFLVPFALFFSMNEELHEYRPLAHPFDPPHSEEQTPFEPDEYSPDVPQTDKNGNGFDVVAII